MQLIKTVRGPVKIMLCALLAIATVPVSASEFNLPSLGDTSSSIMSREQEYQLGRTWLSMLRGSVRTMEDPLLKDYVEQEVYLLAETSQLDDRRLAFVMINSPELNAFAAPGGVIGVNGGLFLHAHTEGEFASVMAHELAHLSQRHFARGLQHQQQSKIPFMAAMLASVVLAASGSDAGFAALASTQAAAIQEQRRFSRQNEQEADRIGLLNLKKAGYDPHAMPDMFERLAKISRFSQTPPEFLLTHPVSQSRIADSRNRAGQLSDNGRRDSLYYQMMRARVQLFYEESPGLAAKRFRALLTESDGKHPTARYGLALALIRSGQQEDAAKELEPLVAAYPDNIAVQLARVELDSSANRMDEALARVNRLLKGQPDNYPLLNAKADLLLRKRDYAATEKVTNRLTRLRNDDPDVWYLASEVHGLANNILALHQARAEYFMLAGDLDQADQQLDLALKKAEDNFVTSSRINARKEEIARRREIVKNF